MRTWSLLFAAVLVSSCNGGRLSPTALDRVSENTSTLRLETRAHGDRIVAMTSMDQIPHEEDDHLKLAARIMGDMHHDMEGMDGMHGYCGDAAGPMHDLMDGVELECEEHHAAMTGAADLPASHLEEMRHQKAMEDRLDAIDSMRETLADHDCGMGNMHD